MSTIQSPPLPQDVTSRAVRVILDAPHFDADRADWIDPHAEVRAEMFTGRLISAWDFPTILEYPWSPGQHAALRIAADLFNNWVGQAPVSSLWLDLDADLQRRALEAIRIRAGLGHGLEAGHDHAECGGCAPRVTR